MISRNNKFKNHRLTKNLDNILYMMNVQKLHEKQICECEVDEICNKCWVNIFDFANINKVVSTNNSTILTNIKNIGDFLHECKVGIILSEVEGACYASLEYLTCGIPVVSVLAKGGRNDFYNSTNSIICEKNINSITECSNKALEKLNNGEFNPDKIRKDALNKIKIHQKILFDLVQKILDNENINLNAEKDIFNYHFIGCKIRLYDDEKIKEIFND